MFINRFGTKWRQAVDTMENMLKNLGDTENEESVEVYKQMLVEHHFREFKTAQRNRQLEKQLKGNDDLDVESGRGNDENCMSRNNVDITPSADYVAQLEDQLKMHMREKIEATALAREHMETSKYFERQLVQLKNHVRDQDSRIQQLETIERSLNEKTKGDESALDAVVTEYSRLSCENEATRQKLSDIVREKQQLENQIERQSRQIELLMTNLSHDDESIDENGFNEREASVREGIIEEYNSTIKALELDLAQERARIMELTNENAKRKTQVLKMKSPPTSPSRGANGNGVVPHAHGDNHHEELQRLRESLKQVEASRKLLETELEGNEQKFQHERAELEQQLQQVQMEKEKANEQLQAETKQHVQDMEGLKAEITTLQGKLETLEKEYETLKVENDQSEQALNQEIQSKKGELATITEKLQKLETELETAQANVNSIEKEKDVALKTIESLNAEKLKLEQAMEQMNQQMAALQAEQAKHEAVLHQEKERMVKEMEGLKKQLAGRVSELEQKLQVVETERDDAFVAMAEFKAEAEAKERAMEQERQMMKGQVEDYKKRYVKESGLRKRVHNELMDLKGNIRVFCRVRPVLPFERESGDGIDVTEYPVDNEIVVSRDEATTNRFEFDAVFAPSVTQEQVFEDISPLVTSVLDGYNVCMFAYGQTGSGKTYTMEGPKEDPGVNFRALGRLFTLSQERENEEFTFSLSILEIYNETIRDLLDGSKSKLDLRVGGDGQVFVQDLTQTTVSKMTDVQKAIKTAQGNRAVGSHNMNEHSSRSHLVLTISIASVNKVSNTKTNGKLNLIDLAGSERVSKTDASGDRLKEAQSINKSLSALGDVIAALGADSKGGKQHVPFRNSKLTHLLQNSLGGDSKVAMFVNISPVRWNASESICSLNFASRCRKVELGKAKKNGESAELKKYRKIVDDLKMQLASQSRTYDSSSNFGTPTKKKLFK